MKVLFIAHGSKQKVANILKSLQGLYHDGLGIWTTLFTKGKGDGTVLAANHSLEADIVVAIGGDGTVSEVINGIMQTGHRPLFGVIPAGSGNDFARSAGYHISLEAFVELLQLRQHRKVDIGIIDYQNSSEYFINIADTGLGPEAVKRVESSPAWMPSGMKFNWAIIRTFFKYKKPTIKCIGPNFEWEERCMLIALANGRYFASGLCVAPQAELDDGLLDVVLVGEVSIIQYLRFLPKLKKGVKLSHPKITYKRMPWVHLDGDSGIEKDGELGHQLPARVSLLTNELPLLDSSNNPTKVSKPLSRSISNPNL